ncbi:WD40 repeat-containing protein HOS15-like [Oryza brachyantha]|uniref:Uncharacterized protein n=1 Tax=Oryza brachyantha TaxID=4533 RepID=J3LQR7_ORYBR|nr:WD40 repeat-containing protein HOS15-like [Oryza brachyantha]XP_015690615.1 WD40 repeat-containing protein HOS15-like [Oryza brachyantha]
MSGPNPGDLTANDLNAAVYRYLIESGFVHTAYNFKHEARLAEYEFEGKKIPMGTLIRVVWEGLRHIELKANSEVTDDENFHHFSSLDLLTKDVAELKREITGRAKPDSVETTKEKKNETAKTVKSHYSVETTKKKKNETVKTVKAPYSVETIKGKKNKTVKTVEAHCSDYVDDTMVYRIQPSRKAKDYSVRLTEESSSNSDEISRERKRRRLLKAKTTAVHKR